MAGDDERGAGPDLDEFEVEAARQQRPSLAEDHRRGPGDDLVEESHEDNTYNELDAQTLQNPQQSSTG